MKGKTAILAIIAILATGIFLFSPASSVPVCGNGLCESGESYLTCSDCPKPYNYYSSTTKEGFTCITGDKTCTQACGEIGQSCISRSCSWGGSCGAPDGRPSEWCNSNPTYSGSLCDVPIATTLTSGFCYCGPAPSVTATPEIKPVAVCGNGICEIGESYLTCSDCPKPISYYSSSPAPTSGTNVTAAEPACYDSDGGLNLYVKGTCKDGNGYYYEACSANGYLTESFCDYGSNACKQTDVPCPNGCSDGACLPVPVCGNGICESGESYLTCSDCPKPINYYSSVKEQVKCVFANSNSLQKCYSDQFGCTGVGTCVADVYGDKGAKLTWKSSCGGYAYTTIDGENEYAEFKCEAVCGNGICEAGESYMTCSDCPKPISYYGYTAVTPVPEVTCDNGRCLYSQHYGGATCKTEIKCKTVENCLTCTDYYDASVCGDGICSGGESYLTCSDCPKPYDYAYSLCGNGKCEAGEDYKSCPSDCQNPFIYPGLSYSIAILPGWNLVSNPLLGVAAGDVLAQLDGNCGDVAGWHYSPKSGYEKPSEFETLKGYWIKASGACKVVLTTKSYPKPEAYVVGLEAGWNQIGAPSEKTPFESVKGGCEVSKGPYWYDPSTNQYVKAAALEPGKGYFVKVAQPCTLKAGGAAGGDAGMPPLPEE